jgi:transposase
MAFPSPYHQGGNMRPFSELTHFAGFDWARDHHDFVLVDKQGVIVEQFRFDDSAEGWHLALSKLVAFPAVGIAIETSSGPFVDRLLDAGFSVFPINARSAKQYRLRKAPSGVKDDKLDAWSLADALRLDGHGWRALKPEDPLTLELRLLCRDESALIVQRTQLINQLLSALREYYPAALEAFNDWTLPYPWAFLLQFPTPDALHAAGKRKWEKFLHVHKLARPETYEKRLEIFSRANLFKGSPPTTSAKSRLAVALAKMLTALEAQLDDYRARIQELYDKHPDKPWFGSLPVAQDGKTAPRLLAELGTDRERFTDAQALQCVAGTAPVRFQSGQIEKCYLRRACNKHLRFAIHWFSNLSRTKCSWASIYYDQKRAQGKSHACALRCLGQRWIKIIWKMWQTHSAYNPDLHQQNQLQHGSWLLQLQPSVKTSAR